MSNAFEIPSSQSMELIGSGVGRTIDLPDALKLSGTLKISSTGYTLRNGTLGLSGGLLDVVEDANIESNITLSVDSTLQIDPSKSMTYGGIVVDIGTSKLNIQGGGSFINSNSFSTKFE